MFVSRKKYRKLEDDYWAVLDKWTTASIESVGHSMKFRNLRWLLNDLIVLAPHDRIEAVEDELRRLEITAAVLSPSKAHKSNLSYLLSNPPTEDA